MNHRDRVMPEPDQPRASAATLARKLDRIVVAARGLRVLDLLGRIVVAAAIGAAIAAVARRADMPLSTPAVVVVVGIAIAAAAWTASRRWRWPDRLSTAMEIEWAHPWMGERISRAVGLATSTPDAGEAAAPDRLLAGKAVAEAIAVLDGRPSARAVDRLAAVRWPLAGLVAVAVVASFLRTPDHERDRRPAGPMTSDDTSVGTGRHALSDDALAAARRLADNAAAGERLAIALLGTFATAPGLRQDELSRRDREWLEATASLHASIVDAMGPDLHVVAKELVASPRMKEDMERHEDRTRRLLAAAGPIRENRLAAAAQSILPEVKGLLGTLESLGVRPSPGIGEGIADQATDRAGLARRRLMAMLDARAAPDEVRADSQGPSVDGVIRGPVNRVESSPADESGSVATRPTGAAAGTAAGDGGSAGSGRTGGEPSVGPAAVDGEPPAWVRAREPRPPAAIVGDGLGIAGRYRTAVDDYYRRLWATESHGAGEREGKGTR